MQNLYELEMLSRAKRMAYEQEAKSERLANRVPSTLQSLLTRSLIFLGMSKKQETWNKPMAAKACTSCS